MDTQTSNWTNSVVSIEILQGSDQNVSRRGALASVATTEGLSSQRSYCKALIKMLDKEISKILFVQFGNCIHAIQKPPFSASRNLTFCYPNELNANIMLNPHPPTPHRYWVSVDNQLIHCCLQANTDTLSKIRNTLIF